MSKAIVHCYQASQFKLGALQELPTKTTSKTLYAVFSNSPEYAFGLVDVLILCTCFFGVIFFSSVIVFVGDLWLSRTSSPLFQHKRVLSNFSILPALLL